VIDPTTQRTQPSIPNVCSFSCRMACASAALQKQTFFSYHFSLITSKEHNAIKFEINIYLMIILSAPRGVTRIAGANA
jgi:hypothetical protein